MIFSSNRNRNDYMGLVITPCLIGSRGAKDSGQEHLITMDIFEQQQKVIRLGPSCFPDILSPISNYISIMNVILIRTFGVEIQNRIKIQFFLTGGRNTSSQRRYMFQKIIWGGGGVVFSNYTESILLHSYPLTQINPHVKLFEWL